MSIDVSSYTQVPYKLTPVAWPVRIFDPPTIKPVSCQLSFNWLVYFAALNGAPNIAVEININSGGTAQGGVMDKVVTVKIDNSNSAVPILVNFPDSGDTVSCPPQSIVTLPVNTNGTRAFVIAQGLSVGFTPQTLVTFYNYFIPPSIDPVLQLTYPQWLGSPTIQRNTNQILTPGFGSPALGDQTVQYHFAMDAINTIPIFGTPRPSGFIYITGIDVKLFLLVAGGTSEQLGSLFAESTGSAGILYEWNYYVVLPSSIYSIYSTYGMNIKIDATQTWRLRNTVDIPTGSLPRMQVGFTYTVNDK